MLKIPILIFLILNQSIFGDLKKLEPYEHSIQVDDLIEQNMLKTVVFLFDYENPSGVNCLGSILNSEYVIVPAKCIKYSNYSKEYSLTGLEIKDVNKFKVVLLKEQKMLDIDKIIINKEFEKFIPNSLALVHLISKLDLFERKTECLIDKSIDKARRLVRISRDDRFEILKDYKVSMHVNDDQDGKPILFISINKKDANFSTDLFFLVDNDGDSYLLGVDGYNFRNQYKETLVDLRYYQDWIRNIVGKNNVCIKN